MDIFPLSANIDRSNATSNQFQDIKKHIETIADIVRAMELLHEQINELQQESSNIFQQKSTKLMKLHDEHKAILESNKPMKKQQDKAIKMEQNQVEPLTHEQKFEYIQMVLNRWKQQDKNRNGIKQKDKNRNGIKQKDKTAHVQIHDKLRQKRSIRDLNKDEPTNVIIEPPKKKKKLH